METLLLSKHMKNPIQSGKKYRMIYQKNIIKKKGKNQVNNLRILD